jgi:excisionase family DNA binding protein
MEIRTIKSMKVEERKTMTVKEFCKEYGIGANKSYELVNSKDFPAFKCGRKIIIIRSKVDEWLENQIGMRF